MDHPKTIEDAELPLLETALLWSMRARVMGRHRNSNLDVRITRMFASLQEPKAAFRLDGFMNDLRLGATMQKNRMVN